MFDKGPEYVSGLTFKCHEHGLHIRSLQKGLFLLVSIPRNQKNMLQKITDITTYFSLVLHVIQKQDIRVGLQIKWLPYEMQHWSEMGNEALSPLQNKVETFVKYNFDKYKYDFVFVLILIILVNK